MEQTLAPTDTPGQFSPETVQFLQQVAPDMRTAIEHAPDEELQQVSGLYRHARERFDEARAKRLMQAAVKPRRVEMLALMQQLVAEPKLREFLAQEHAQARLIHEHRQLMEVADVYGDDAFADEIAAKLRAELGMVDALQGEAGAGDGYEGLWRDPAAAADARAPLEPFDAGTAAPGIVDTAPQTSALPASAEGFAPVAASPSAGAEPAAPAIEDRPPVTRDQIVNEIFSPPPEAQAPGLPA
ncbi:MAG: hypothetical protein VYC42_01640 [Pseudomonadota bacterium]|nr:hypothetical protein [Pseudomonadota bacterium]